MNEFMLQWLFQKIDYDRSSWVFRTTVTGHDRGIVGHDTGTA